MATCSQGASPSAPDPRGGSRFWGDIWISSLYRRFIVAFPSPWIVDISAIFELHVKFNVNIFICHFILHGECSGAQEAHALRAAMPNAVYICKLNEPGPIRCSIIPAQPFFMAIKGPQGAQGRLPVTKRCLWTSHRPMTV